MSMTPLVSVLAIVMLFLFGLQNLSRELEQLIKGSMQQAFERLTQNRVIAALTAAFATALIQSSSAITALAVTLVEARVLSLKRALAVLIGSNIGTASTAFLVSFKLQGLGAYFIVLGSILSFLPIRLRVVGKSIFYFGFVLFILDELSQALRGAMDPATFETLILGTQSPLIAILVGIVMSAVFQSSSLVTGLAVILSSQHLLPLPMAVAIALGANIGTTTTALIASVGMKTMARKAAIANFIFNLTGVILVYPFLEGLTDLAANLSNHKMGMAVAWSHLIFNSALAILFLPLITPLYHLLDDFDFKRFLNR